MARTPRGVQAKARHKKILDLAKGYRGASSRSFRSAKQAVIKAAQYAYRDRRTRRRNLRSLWIVRINAAARLHELTYSEFMAGLKCANVDLNRKMLSELACLESGFHPSFVKVVERVKSAIQDSQAKAA